MSEMSTPVLFKTNAAGKVEYLYQIGPMVVKHSVTMEEARRICGNHPISASDRFPAYPCCVRGNYFFPPLITTGGEWPVPEAPGVNETKEVEAPSEESPVEPAPVVEPDAPKPVKPKTPAKPKGAKPKTTTRKKVQK